MVLNKTDLLEDSMDPLLKISRSSADTLDNHVVLASALTGDGLEDLLVEIESFLETSNGSDVTDQHRQSVFIG